MKLKTDEQVLNFELSTISAYTYVHSFFIGRMERDIAERLLNKMLVGIKNYFPHVKKKCQINNFQ